MKVRHCVLFILLLRFDELGKYCAGPVKELMQPTKTLPMTAVAPLPLIFRSNTQIWLYKLYGMTSTYTMTVPGPGPSGSLIGLNVDDTDTLQGSN